MTGNGAPPVRATGRHRSPIAGAARTVLIASFRARRAQLWRLVGWSTVEALPALLSGVLVALAIDEGFLTGRVVIGFGWLSLLAISVVVGAWGTRQTLTRLATVVEPFRDELVTAVVTEAVRDATQRGVTQRSVTQRGVRQCGVDPAGAEVTRLTQQVEIVREAYASVLIVVQQFAVVTVGALVGLLALAPAALLAVVPPLALSLGLFGFVLQRMALQQRASILADEDVARTATKVGSGLRDIAACGGQDLAHTSVGVHIDDARAATVAVSRLTACATLAVAIGGWLPLILILAMGSWLTDRGATIGVLLGAATYVLQGLQPALQTLVDGLSGPGLWLMVTLRRMVETGGAGAVSMGAVSTGAVSVSDARSAVSATGSVRTTNGARPAGSTNGSAPAGRHDLRLTAVTFGYGESAEPVVRGLDLTIPEGDHLAIVGPSGAGKSTLAGLMSGLLTPQAGQVRLGGVDLVGQAADHLAGNRVLIPQEAYVFAGIVRENLGYLRPAVGDADLDAAVQALGAVELIRRLGGYDAELDPSALSAGERQLITLVRAYVAAAPTVILDEATCHLDPAAEARVELAFAKRPGTLIVIAHRMSSALRARRILVLDGSAAELGRHEDLLQRSPLYRDLIGHWTVPAEAASTA